MPDLISLRSELKRRRNAVTARQREHYERQAWRLLQHDKHLNNSQHIGCYISVSGEFPTGRIIQQLQHLGKTVYLPLLNRNGENSLHFQQLTARGKMHSNRFGIPEPIPNARMQIPTQKLDMVITPLLGFDRQFSRLGMGGGFYDRSFAFLLEQRLARKPWMLGLGFDAQEVEHLERNDWDIPLDAMLTESRLTLKPPGVR